MRWFNLISRNGVCYDLNVSEYRYTTGNLTFVFSSQLHLDKFKNKVKENQEIINYSLTRRFNIKCDVTELANVVLYRKIETRGFLIVTNEGVELCQENLIFVGGKVTVKNSKG